MAKDVITEADKARVIYAIRTAPSADIGLPTVTVGWRCNKAGTRWAETVLEQLLGEKRVVKIVSENEQPICRVLWKVK